MKTIIYAIYDKKAKGYRSLFTEDNHETCKRALIHAINETDTTIAKNPSDYALYQLGYYAHTDGIITPELELVIDLDQLDQRMWMTKEQYETLTKVNENEG